MTTEVEAEQGSEWKQFMKKHWTVVAIFVVAIILAAAGAVYVFWWFTGYAQNGLVPSTLGLWSMGNLIFFILHLIFWELLLIGIPTAICAIIGWQWWERLPQEEKVPHLFGRSSRSRNAGSGVSALLFIAFAIKVYIDNNWNTPMSTYTLNYVVGSIITILAWVAIIFGIPATIAAIWWLHRQMHRKP
jgi:hypothetical protein